MKIYIRYSLILLVSLLVLLISSCAFFFYYEQQRRYNFRVKLESSLSPDAAQYYDEIELIKNYFDSQRFKTKSEKFDFIRNWIHMNSIHEIDLAYSLRDAFNTPKNLSMLWKTYKKGDIPARLTCGPRAMAMKYMLDKLNEKSRIVMIFSDTYDHVVSHTFLEVFNIETNSFEVQDPDYNIYYIDNNFKRIDVSRMIFGDSEKIKPISFYKKGWSDNKIIHIKREYLKAFMYGNPVTTKNPIIVINEERFDTDKKFTKNGGISFYEFANKYYNDPFLLKLNDKNINFIINPIFGALIDYGKLP